MNEQLEKYLKLFKRESARWLKDPEGEYPNIAVGKLLGVTRQRANTLNQRLRDLGYINATGTRLTKKGEAYKKD